jgi:ABC-2 type transport system ATP-binding protein
VETEALVIRGLEKSFRRFKLGPLDLNVPRGAIYGLIGANGAGKTTTIELIMRMGRKDAGTIEVFGLDHIKDEVAVKRQVGFVSPNLSFTPWGKINDLIEFYSAFYPDWDRAFCTDLMKRLKLSPGDTIETLSFGSRTKLNLLLALSHRPALLLLDEPLVGLDAISKHEVFTELLDAVQDENRTVLISSHNIDDIERFADHVGILHEGKLLLEGPTSDLVERFRMVHCSSTNGAAPKSIRGVYVQQQDGNRWRLLVDTQQNPVESLGAKGMTNITAAPVTLEEMFVAMVKGQ